MSQEIKNDFGDKNQNEPCRAKHRRPDKQLYVPRAKREAQQTVDMTSKPESHAGKSEIMNPFEQGLLNDRKTSGSPPNSATRREKKKSTEKNSVNKVVVDPKKCSNATIEENSKNGGRAKANQKAKKKTDVDKQKSQSSNASSKSGTKIASTKESPCPTQSQNIKLETSSSKIDLRPLSDDSGSITEAKNIVSDEQNTQMFNEEIDINENSEESFFNFSEKSVAVSRSPPNSEPPRDSSETSIEQAILEQFYPCQDYFSPSELSIGENALETNLSTDTKIALGKQQIIVANDNTAGENVAAKDYPIVNATDKIAVKKDSSDSSDFTWETMYNDDGECLHPELVNELTDAVGKVKIEKAKLDYSTFQPKDPVIGDSEFNHVIEIYDFPAEFRTTDLVAAFSQFKNRGFDIKWVDDTHALGLFASPIAAADALTICHPFIKTRPLSQASRESKLKARKCAEFLQPYRPRPETSASLARRLVGGALGLQVHVSKEQREKERQKLRDAKEKKKHAAKQKNEIWEGVVPNSVAKVS